MSLDKKECLYDISVIIITYNSKDYILNCITSLNDYKSRNDFKIEIIIIDNNSTDNTSDILKHCRYGIHFFSNNDNIGFAKACNKGINIARGKYVFILNPDTKLLNNAIKIFYDFMEKEENKKIWCVGAQLVDENMKPVKSSGRFPNLFDVVFEQTALKGFVLKLLGKKYLKKKNSFPHSTVVEFVMGCNMFIRKKILKEIGSFNEEFFLNFEEAELTWRAKKKGFNSMVLPFAKILHYSGKSFFDKKSYLSSLYLGQIIFFKLTHKPITFKVVKGIHFWGTVLRLIVKRDETYLLQLKKICLLK